MYMYIYIYYTYIYPRSPKDILKMVVPVKDIFYAKDIFYKEHFPQFKALSFTRIRGLQPFFLMPQ